MSSLSTGQIVSGNSFFLKCSNRPLCIYCTELAWTVRIIKDATGFAPTVMRPPYGDDNENVRRVSTAMGLSVVEWNRDTEDYKFSTWRPGDAGSPNSIAQQFTTWVAQPLQGTISLQHDIQIEPARQAAPAIDVVMRAGYQLVTVAECIGKPAYSDSLLTLLNGGNPPPPSPVTFQAPIVTTMVVPPVTTVISSTTTVLPAMTKAVPVDPPTVTGSDGVARKINGTGVQSAGVGLTQHSGIWTVVLAAFAFI